MITYSFPRMLTQTAWEAALSRSAIPANHADAECNLHLDFSQVEFSDILALAGSLLLIDAAVTAPTAAAVTVSLPAAANYHQSGQPGEIALLAAHRARARGDALAYMRQAGFVDSLRAPHWPTGAVQIVDRGIATDEDTDTCGGSSEPSPTDVPYRRRRLFPLRWLEPMSAGQSGASDSLVAVADGLKDLGLSGSDARTLSQTVLTEFSENTGCQSARLQPPVLVGATWLSAQTYSHRQRHLPQYLLQISERAQADECNVLRLIVADPGTSLAARLTADPDLGSGPEDTSAFWWVTRVVRSYNGGLQARTADLLAGIMFGRDPGGRRLFSVGYGHLPGALLELTLPTSPSGRPLPSGGGPPGPTASSDLGWVHCIFDPQHGLANADRAVLAHHLRTARDGLVVTVLVQDPGSAELDDRWRSAVYQLLEFAHSMAHERQIIVVFPDTEPNLLLPCLAAYNEESAEEETDPFLVIALNGEQTWCAGSGPLRAVLTGLLTAGDGALSLVQARRYWESEGGDRSGLDLYLRSHGQMIAVDGERLVSKLSVSAVHETVASGFEAELARLVSQNGQGVSCGRFRGPTLRLTNRWIDVDALLRPTPGADLAAFILARKAMAAVRSSASPTTPTAVLQVRSAPRQLTRQLSECLALGGRYFPQQSELNVGETAIGEHVPVGAKVILCTDLISTENTIRRAVASVAGHGAEPLIIACVLDARSARGPIGILNRQIPVVSLAEVDISAGWSADEQLTDIDPVLLRPETAASEPVSPAEIDLFNWFETVPDVLRLGHIDDPPQRHYSAFIRLQAMRQQNRDDELIEAIMRNLRASIEDVSSHHVRDPAAKRPIAIWYIATDGNAETLADVVSVYLSDQGFSVTAVTPIPRWTQGDTWSFPASLGAAAPPGVVILHWWSITGSTLLQMIRLAARSGARWIAALCVLNQLEANDADAIRMLRAVAAPGQGPAPGQAVRRQASPATIPVAIRFAAVSSISAFDTHECPICKTCERYRFDEETSPSRIYAHASLLRDMLRPRELAEVALDSAADLFIVPVTGYEAVDYLRWRSLLVRALREVRGRQEVVDRLTALAAGTVSGREWTSAALIRLLAAEQHWLRLPPLTFGFTAQLLSRVCVVSFGQLTMPSWLRLQAVMVLCAAAPQRMVELLPELVATAGTEVILIDQILTDCYRLLLRSPGDMPIDVARLRHSLVQCRDFLETQQAGQDAASATDQVHATRSLITVASYRTLRKPRDDQAAWDRLREDLVRGVVRHNLESDLLLVRSFVEDIEAEEPPAELALARAADWETCARQLEELALVNLPPLREILSGDFVGDWLGRRQQRRLLTLARPDVAELRAVADRLHALTNRPWLPDDPSWQATRRELLDRINWWNRMFLAAHVDEESAALLVELIRSAPLRLETHVTAYLTSRKVTAEVFGRRRGRVGVFCPQKLLDQILAHALDNIRKHRVAGEPSRIQVAYLRPSTAMAQLLVRNSGTVATGPPGRGLSALNDKLRPFGGGLAGQVLTGVWTFELAVTLPVWHGDRT
jgi:adenine/guanine phosphoribosyltransferase-like PRPP-binding protein